MDLINLAAGMGDPRPGDHFELGNNFPKKLTAYEVNNPLTNFTVTINDSDLVSGIELATPDQVWYAYHEGSGILSIQAQLTSVYSDAVRHMDNLKLKLEEAEGMAIETILSFYIKKPTEKMLQIYLNHTHRDSVDYYHEARVAYQKWRRTTDRLVASLDLIKSAYGAARTRNANARRED